MFNQIPTINSFNRYKRKMKLPLNCTVKYIPNFLSKSESNALYNELLENYKIDQLRTEILSADGIRFTDYGKLMFIDEDILEADKLPEAQWGKSVVWSDRVKSIKARIEEIVKKEFNVCVCIYYPDGHSGIGFHSDYTAFGDTNLIPSLSIGEEREFLLREKETSNIHTIKLMEGSLLIMGENCQQRYEHSLPVDPKYKKGRINLTFRPYGFS
jgi:alkylated DNA repair dioxygenase AlkB